MALIEIKEAEAKLREEIIRRTQSLCPECNRILDAEILERDSKIYLRKVCPEHGEVEELYYGSAELYKKFSTYWRDGKGIQNPNVPVDSCACPMNCGLCTNHLSHTGLANIIITNR
ncbi:MAG: radical SAM protein, partial [Nitrososphaerales archaeon]